RFGQAEVLREEMFGRVADPVGDAECAKFREVSVVEDEDEMSRLVPETLEHVAVAAGEIPDVAGLEIVGLGAPPRIDHGCPHAALDDKRPLGGRGVPVQLAHGARLQLHRDARDTLGDRQLLDGGLLAVAAADHLALRLLQLELEGRQLIPGEQGSGTLFLNENSSSAAFKPTMLAAATAEPMNPRRESSDMVSPCRRVIRKRGTQRS